MKHIAGWFRRNNTLMAQAKDLQRQLQEAWDKCDELITERALLVQDADYLRNQLSRLSRERYQERGEKITTYKKLNHAIQKGLVTEKHLDQERELRLEAEAALLECHLSKREKDEEDRAADRGWLADVENEEE